MSKRTIMSQRGELVDFDLFNIKNNLSAIPLNEQNKQRERFINKKKRRGLKRRVDELAQIQRLNDANISANLSIDSNAIVQENIVQQNQSLEINESVKSDLDQPSKKRKVIK